MAKHVTIAPEQTEAAIIALGASNSACEGRIYPASDADVWYLGVADGTLLGPMPGDGGDGGIPAVINTVTLSAGTETSMRVRYEGAVAPILTKISDGNYRLVSGAASRVLSFVWTANPAGLDAATYTGGAVNLLVRDAAGESLYGVYEAISQTTGQDARNIPGVLLAQTVPTVGDVNVKLPNAASISGGFILIGKIV